MAPALGEGPERAQDPRQPRPRSVRLSVLGVPDSRSAASTFHRSSSAARPKSPMAGMPAPGNRMLALQGAVAERGREIEGLLARRNSAVGVSRLPAYLGHPGQHPSQPGPIVERPGQGLGLAQQGEAPSMLSQSAQRASQRKAEIDGPPQVSPSVGQVREGLEGLLEGGDRLAEGGAVIGPGASLLAVGDGLVPHLAPHGMVRQAFDLLGHPLGRQCLERLDNARVQLPPPLLAGGCRRRPPASGHA